MIGSGTSFSNASGLSRQSHSRFRSKKPENRELSANGNETNDGVDSLSCMSGSILAVAIATTVALSGCAKAVVPDVSQQDLGQAQQMLATAKLKTGKISGPAGAGEYVVSQSPVAGQQVLTNSPVDLVVQLPITVPVLTGQDVTDAVSALQGLGLKVSFLRQAGNLFTKTTVMQQAPAAGSSVHINATITLTVSTPPSFAAWLGLASKEAAYQNLDPQYKNALDAFLGRTNGPTGAAAGASIPGAPAATRTAGAPTGTTVIPGNTPSAAREK
jgi:PASTA domain